MYSSFGESGENVWDWLSPDQGWETEKLRCTRISNRFIFNCVSIIRYYVRTVAVLRHQGTQQPVIGNAASELAMTRSAGDGQQRTWTLNVNMNNKHEWLRREMVVHPSAQHTHTQRCSGVKWQRLALSRGQYTVARPLELHKKYRWFPVRFGDKNQIWTPTLFRLILRCSSEAECDELVNVNYVSVSALCYSFRNL